MARSRRRPINREIATTRDGRDITRGYVPDNLPLPPQDRILRGLGNNYEKYEELLTDDQVQSTIQQRRRAIISKEWEILPGGTSRQDKKARDFVAEILEGIPVDQIHNKMWSGFFYGYSVGEVLWKRDGAYDGIEAIKVRKQQRFVFDGLQRIRLLTSQNYLGEILPDRKFWAFSTGADNDDDPYGLGLAHHLYWLVYFKKNGLKYWLKFLEKYGNPTKWGRYDPSASEKTKQELLATLQALTNDSGIITPKGVEIALLEATQRAGADYSKLHEVCDNAIAKVVLSQTMTTENGSSRSQAEVHQGVADDVIKGDADLLCASFNETVIRWLVEYNFPEGTKLPKFWRKLESPEDLNSRITRDKTLFDMGFSLMPEAVKDTYGEGYERRQNPPLTPLFAETSTTDLQTATAQKSTPIITGWIDQVRDLLTQSPDLTTFAEKIEQIYPDLNRDEYANIMAQARAIAHLGGMSDV